MYILYIETIKANNAKLKYNVLVFPVSHIADTYISGLEMVTGTWENTE